MRPHVGSEDLLPARRWDDDPDQEPEDRPFAGVSDAELLGRGRADAPSGDAQGAAVAAGLAWGRLDARLRTAGPAVRAGWLARMLLEEAAASARLDGHIIDADELLAWDVGLDLGGPPSPSLSYGIQVLQTLRLAAGRHPRSFWTPRRLARLAGALPRTGVEGAWRGGEEGRQDTGAALADLLHPGRVNEWKRAPALLAAAALLRDWEQARVGGALGGFIGRALAQAWVWREGDSLEMAMPAAWGFLGAASDFAPWREDWPLLWLGGVERGSRRGQDLLSALLRAQARLERACEGRRRSSRLPRLAELLLERPAVGTQDVATALDLSRQGALNLLEELRAAGGVREISRRESHWVWQTALM